jgi:pimeloyl-ACP methyl ester carboxylesterase
MLAPVVEAIAERLELFTAEGAPRRSWLRMRLRRAVEPAAPDRAAELAPRPPVELVPGAPVPESQIQTAPVLGGLLIADEVVDIAQGLGEQVSMAGISMGGVVTAWAAQNRPDIARPILNHSRQVSMSRTRRGDRLYLFVGRGNAHSLLPLLPNPIPDEKAYGTADGQAISHS